MSRGPRINGKLYELVVLRVVDWDEQGRPSRAEIGYEGTTFDLTNKRLSREFLTAFVPYESTKPVAKN